MSTSLYIQCGIAGLLGILFHVFAVRYPAVKKRAAAANEPTTLKAFIADDWGALAASLITVLVCITVLDELLKFKPEIADYVKFFFVAVGYMGSSTLQALLNNADRKLLDIIDKKTNIADGVIPPENN